MSSVVQHLKGVAENLAHDAQYKRKAGAARLKEADGLLAEANELDKQYLEIRKAIEILEKV
jgi:hypothetical protein